MSFFVVNYGLSGVRIVVLKDDFWFCFIDIRVLMRCGVSFRRVGCIVVLRLSVVGLVLVCF